MFGIPKGGSSKSPLTGTCMCGHTSSLHTGSGGGCEAKYTNHLGKQVVCPCTGFYDKGAK